MTAINNEFSAYRLVFGATKISITNEKILGFLLNNKLSWRSHVRRVRSRSNSMINALWRAASCLNEDTRSKVFNTFMKPLVLYSATVWGNGTPTETAKMDTVL